jgi:hypothetical protein
VYAPVVSPDNSPWRSTYSSCGVPTGVPALSKWVEVTNTDAAGPVPLLSQMTIETLHVPWNLRNRLHAETAYMPSQGVRNR